MPTENATEQSGLARIPEAAKFLSVSKSTLYNLIRDGKVPNVKIGDSTRIPWGWLHAQAKVQP